MKLEDLKTAIAKYFLCLSGFDRAYVEFSFPQSDGTAIYKRVVFVALGIFHELTPNDIPGAIEQRLCLELHQYFVGVYTYWLTTVSREQFDDGARPMLLWRLEPMFLRENGKVVLRCRVGFWDDNLAAYLEKTGSKEGQGAKPL